MIIANREKCLRSQIMRSQIICGRELSGEGEVDVDMKTIIKQVLDLDARAQQMLQDAYREREKKMAQVDKEAEEQRIQLSEHCQQRIELIRQQESDLADEEIEKVLAGEKQAIARLDERFEAGRAQWVSEIVSHITG